jgi:phosphoserine phosphatase
MPATQSRRRLIVTDFDSTLVRQEVIDVLAQHAGAGEQVAAITERAMRGELDFDASLRERVSLLAGMPISALAEVQNELVFSPGAENFVAECHDRGWLVGVISGGFREVVEPVASWLTVDMVRANRLETHLGYLTGRVLGDIVNKTVKAETLAQWAAQRHVPMSDTIAIGDGANDILMLKTAGIGIAYRAKPAVQAAADYAVSGQLDDVLKLIYGITGG